MEFLDILIPFLLLGFPVGCLIGFVVFLVLFLHRRSINKNLPFQAQKSTVGFMIGFIVCGAIALCIIVPFIVMVVLIDSGAIRFM